MVRAESITRYRRGRPRRPRTRTCASHFTHRTRKLRHPSEPSTSSSFAARFQIHVTDAALTRRNPSGGTASRFVSSSRHTLTIRRAFRALRAECHVASRVTVAGRLLYTDDSWISMARHRHSVPPGRKERPREPARQKDCSQCHCRLHLARSPRSRPWRSASRWRRRRSPALPPRSSRCETARRRPPRRPHPHGVQATWGLPTRTTSRVIRPAIAP